MAFRVEISPRAFADLDVIVSHIKEHGSFEQARKWFNEMIDAITSLKDMPCWCPIAGELEQLMEEKEAQSDFLRPTPPRRLSRWHPMRL